MVGMFGSVYCISEVSCRWCLLLVVLVVLVVVLFFVLGDSVYSVWVVLCELIRFINVLYVGVV